MQELRCTRAEIDQMPASEFWWCVRQMVARPGVEKLTRARLGLKDRPAAGEGGPPSPAAGLTYDQMLALEAGEAR